MDRPVTQHRQEVVLAGLVMSPFEGALRGPVTKPGAHSCQPLLKHATPEMTTRSNTFPTREALCCDTHYPRPEEEMGPHSA